jgi:Sec-independent protein secretion pathway component TatC
VPLRFTDLIEHKLELPERLLQMILSFVVMTTCEGRRMTFGKWGCDLDVSVTVVTVVLWKWLVGMLQGDRKAYSRGRLKLRLGNM